MSGDAAEGAGVGVVCARAGGGFSLGTAALRGVLRAELRALPVAVLSVAGATRGGKSFLLDFCLRYLKATPAARSDGSWLGTDDEPLEGFSWRGGCDRDTIGIQIWSEPFVLTRQNGEKVVVLLMDTQGTFDSRSTVRDSTTIFAMSTLLSSVQIFNISGNIQEDHLQYLQLFTEYGKLAKEECGTPFQDLMFLVRDWSYAYQHPLGAQGGQEFMEKRLQIDESQAEELKEVRQHILASFESVRCFLMPHPGLAVATSPHFKGCLADISKEFKDALLELIHGLFEENLTLKKVNGQEIQLQELEEYFESYMEMFNSDQMPTPVSILKATSVACLEAARSSARALYEGHMGQGGVEGEGQGQGEGVRGWSCPRAALLRRHAAAMREARDAFLQRRTLAAPERAAEALDLLIQELKGLFSNYVALNDANTQATISDAKAAYTERMLNITECLLPSELETRHREAIDEALALFDRFRQLPTEPDDEGTEEEEDEDRCNLQKELNNFFDEITKNNEANINAAMAVALEKYVDGVCQGRAPSSLCLLSEHLKTLHKTATDAAEEEFRSNFISQGRELNAFVVALLCKICEKYEQLRYFNENNNDSAVDTALQFYENNMKTNILNDGCLHPADLQIEHNTLYKSTMTAFYRSRTYGSNEIGRDNHKLRLITELTKIYNNFVVQNENLNKEAVKAAHEFYLLHMRTGAFPGFFLPLDLSLFGRHQLIKPRALNTFYQSRGTGQRHTIDKHRDELIRLIDMSYTWLIVQLFGKGGISLGYFFLFRRFV